MRRHLFAVLLLCSSLFAQDGKQRFRLELKTANLTGTDEYTIAKTENGYRISGTTEVKAPSGPLQFSHTEDVAPDWTMNTYKLEASSGSVKQTVELTRLGDHITGSFRAGEQNIPREIAWKPNTVVLDNFIAAHYQALLNAYLAAKPEARSDWNLVIAQRMTVAIGKLSPTPTSDTGTLDGKPISLKKYSLEIGGLLIEIWADATSNQFMRAWVPLQQFEYVREGFVLVPAKVQEVSTSNCIDRDASFASGNLTVPATFCLPRMEKPGTKLPVVVLVHGSGPHDRDETIGPNKPFRDLAEGLAAKGIATLRYEKRTYFAKQSITPTSTVEDEVITDAVAALNAASKLPEAGSIFLLGHSLGGSMAPFIINRYGKASGMILMAAASIPLDETMERQVAAQMKLAGASQSDIDARVNDLKSKFGDVRSGARSGAEPIFGATAQYWSDLFRHDVPAELKKASVPVLVLQGGKDIQVVKADYDLITKSLSGKAAQFEWLPGLNHLFMTVEGDSTGAEYGKPGHVSTEVITIVSKWVLGHESK